MDRNDDHAFDSDALADAERAAACEPVDGLMLWQIVLASVLLVVTLVSL